MDKDFMALTYDGLNLNITKMRKPNILILVHVEEMFRQYFPDEMYPKRLIKACRSKKYDRVICCVSMIDELEPIQELSNERKEIVEWGWGYDDHVFEGNDKELKWVIDSKGHDYTWIPPELRKNDIENANIFLGGGYDGECLADMECILDYLGIKYQRVPGYIYG